MPNYIVEVYVPRSRAAEPEAAGLALQSAVAELRVGGVDIHYVRTTLLPDDETCFHVLEAPSAAEVAEACRRAALDQVRIVAAVEASPPRR